MSQGHKLRVVDLGCGLGNNIGEFIKTGTNHFGDDPLIRVIAPETCLGIDSDEKFRGDLEGRGYQFLALEVAAPGAFDVIPQADYFLLWQFLDRLPSRAWVDAVLTAAVHKARKGVWVRLTSYEQDFATGEGRLRGQGLRFAWSDDPARPTHYMMADVIALIGEYRSLAKRNSVSLRPTHGRRIRSTDDPCVVRIDAPSGTTRHSESHGPKPSQALNPMLVADWEVIITP